MYQSKDDMTIPFIVAIMVGALILGYAVFNSVNKPEPNLDYVIEYEDKCVISGYTVEISDDMEWLRISYVDANSGKQHEIPPIQITNGIIIKSPDVSSRNVLWFKIPIGSGDWSIIPT